jgi:G3E family GTPase
MDKISGVIPTFLITGFLGAGKTTLIQRLLLRDSDQSTVILINEIGKTGIDTDLLGEGPFTKIELNGGSFFCICLRTDVFRHLEHIADVIKPQRLIIEATGIADTSDMQNLFALPFFKDKIRVRANLCMVDCVTFPKVRNVLRAPVSQIRSADLVVVNKTDCVDPEAVDSVIRSIRKISSDVPVVQSVFSDFPLEILDVIERPIPETSGPPGEGRPDPIGNLSVQGDGSFTRDQWDSFWNDVSPNLYRMKGFVVIDNVPCLVNAVMDHLTLTPMKTLRGPSNRLVMIGPKLRKLEIMGKFNRIIGPVRNEPLQDGDHQIK